MVSQIASIAIAIVVVAGVFAVVSSTNTAAIIDSTTGGFANSIRAALGNTK